MTAESIQQFKELIRQYCRQEINAGHCGEDICEFCPINQAYDRIITKHTDNGREDSDECL